MVLMKSSCDSNDKDHDIMLSSSFSRKQKDATYVYDLPGATRRMKGVFTCSLENETKKTRTEAHMVLVPDCPSTKNGYKKL